eukprot:g17061.t1
MSWSSSLLVRRLRLLHVLAFALLYSVGVEAALGGGEDTDFVVEAHGLDGVLWRHKFPGGLARTSVGDLRDHHMATIADGDAATSGQEIADWRSYFDVFAFRLSFFADLRTGVAVVHKAPSPFLDAEQTMLDNAALEDDAEMLEFAFNRAWPPAPGQHANVEVKTLGVQVIAGAGCFSEKGFGVVQALLAPPERPRYEDPDIIYRVPHPAAAALRGYPEVHPAEGGPARRPIDEVRGAKWFGLPGDGSDWIPVGEPLLFQHEVTMETLLGKIMPKQLQIHWNPTSEEAAGVSIECLVESFA